MCEDVEISRWSGVSRAKELYAFGQKMQEWAVSSIVPFMSFPEMEVSLCDPRYVWFVATKLGKAIGACLVSKIDPDRACGLCIMYLGVAKENRRTGIGTRLIEFVLAFLKENGHDYVYTWADEYSGVLKLMDKLGFAKGRKCVWMDKTIF